MANMEKHDTPEVLTVLNPAISVSYKSNYISANKLVLYQKKKKNHIKMFSALEKVI